MSNTMLEDTVKDYAAYLKLDVTTGFQTVQDVIDNMITRLEELTSVAKMVKIKNRDCSTSISSDISRYRQDINTLSKKIATLNEVILILQGNVDVLEKHIEKAEVDFCVNNDNKLKSLLKPFLKKNQLSNIVLMTHMEKTNFNSVLDNFEAD